MNEIKRTSINLDAKSIYEKLIAGDSIEITGEDKESKKEVRFKCVVNQLIKIYPEQASSNTLTCQVDFVKGFQSQANHMSVNIDKIWVCYGPDQREAWVKYIILLSR
jgi:hypothetical protein